MKTIKILGTGCTNCKVTEAVVREVVAELSIDVSIEKVEDMQQIMEFDVMSTPAIVVDGKVVLSGQVPSKEACKNLLVSILANEAMDTTCCSGDTSCC
ncbi:MAG: TM0996/MTH895 family glutaredoxin-like protein [Flavobacteriaceae bacterium]|nr:TM0996/MTH895 family glutaredoxin-like protein [Flavobacteriaceae bacterium]